ncbi:bifunctional phosphoribosylaminoimidazole carboxylase/phosphoribosylaminoimidazole succinocarboxamide synthetase isoform X7 [Chrysemys picta bellii]|uniref:bifunctional phosphoribosylaminoimidazole carboxylase/phosphoribosylaminoimidazole succinocarboxamide synthetase isoform X7 n=1 Tax=Chrysemys picta bellii TaxID=8478 RepID=UPI0032B2C1EC
MESGAGKHWTEEEVKALLSVWSEKNIRKQLHGTLRNKGIFIYIAKRLQELGVCRDWKQCRAKYKNLKYEFRTVKYAHNSGDATKTMKFFHDLDAILQYEPVTQLTEDENGRCSATERQLNISTTTENTEGEISVALEEDEDVPEDPLLFISHVRPIELGNSYLCLSPTPPDVGNPTSILETSKNPPFIPTVANEGGKHWTVNEVRALIHIWSDKNIQQQLEVTVRNKRIFEQVAARLQKFGIERDWKQCRTKYKNLKHEYKSVKNAQDSGNTSKSMKFFNELDAILGHNTGEQSSKSDNEEGERPTEWIEAKTEKDSLGIPGDTGEEDSVSNMSEELQVTHIEKVSDTVLPDKFKEDKSVSNLLEELGATHIKEEEDIGLDPYDKQHAQILSGCLNGFASRGCQKIPEDKEDFINFTPEDLESTHIKKETIDIDDDSISTTSEDISGPSVVKQITGTESVGDIITNTGPWGIKRKASDESSPGPLKKSASEKAVVQFQRSLTDRMHTVTEGKKALLERLCKQEETQDISRTQLYGDPPAIKQVPAALAAAMAPVATELKLGKKINEGKTKEVYELPDLAGCVLMQSKDQITAGNAARKDHMEGKAAISNTTTSCVFQLLHESGIKTAFVRKHGDTAFIAAQCEMIPIEWVCRRIATGSFLKRNPGVKEGYKFYPPKIEMFYKDDAANDPQWSEEQLIEAKFCFAGLTIGQTEVDIMAHSTQAIFEILEKSWFPQNCTLVDMKIEFGVNITTKEIVLADVIDNDSWRLWPSGDRSQQKDKQSYRDLKEVTPEALQMVKRNFEWVAERVELLLKTKSHGRVVVLMGSSSDLGHCEKIKKACANFGIPCELRVTSAHKGPDETLRIKAEYEGDGIPTVFVAVAGRSNGLGPVLSGNTSYPVVNCPPLSADWGPQDVWSSLRLPSGLGCPTILSPEGAAQFAAQIFGLSNHLVWAKLRSSMLNTWISLKQADKKLRECTL